MPHQRLGAGAGREAHLDAAAGVRGSEERLRPGRVVAVVERLVRAVDRERLGVRHEALDGEPEVEALLHRALRHHAGAPGLRTDQQRHGIQRRVARHPDGRLAFGEAAQRSLGGVGGEQRRVLLEVRDVRLVGGCPPGAQALEREHHLDRVEQAGDTRELRRRQPAGEPHELGAWDVDVDQQARQSRVLECHRLGGDGEVDPVRGDEAVERVEALARLPVELADDAVGDDQRRFRIARPIHGDEAERGLGADQRLAPERRGRAHPEALAARFVAHASLRSRSRSASTMAASRTKAAQRGAAASARWRAIVSSSSAVARRGRSAV